MPEDRPQRRILKLLEEALRRDIHFIARHKEDYPQGLFQCLWNTCWWYDCPAAAKQYIEPEEGWTEKNAPWSRTGPKLYKLMEQWRDAKATASPYWTRSLRPPTVHLASSQMAVLHGHEGRLNSVALLPDGHRAVSAAQDNTLRLWDISTGEQLAVLAGHKASVNDVSISPDGQRIASASSDRTVRLWDAVSAQAVAVFHGHDEQVRSVAFSHDGRRIVTGGGFWGQDYTVRVWDADSGEGNLVLHGHQASINSVAVSPSDQRIVSGADDGTARIWDIGEVREVAVLRGHQAQVNCVAISPTGQYIVTGSWDGTVRCWDANTAQQLAVLVGHQGAVWCVAVSPNGRFIVSGSGDRTIRKWDVATCEEQAVYQGHVSDVKGVAVSHDALRIVSAADETLRVWDAASNGSVAELRRHNNRINSVAVSSNGEYVVSGAGGEFGWPDNTVRVWDAASGEEIAICSHRDPVYGVAISPDSQYVASAGQGVVLVWDTKRGRKIAALRGHSERINNVNFSPDGKRIVSGSWDCTARVWDTRGFSTRRSWWSIVMDGLLAAFGKESSECICVLEGHDDTVSNVAISPDSRSIVTGSPDMTVRLWNANSGKMVSVLRGHLGMLSAVAFSPDGRRIASADSIARDICIRVWDFRTGDTLAILPGHTNGVHHVAFSSNGHYIVGESTDKIIRIWDATTFQCLRVIQGHGDVKTIALGSDGGFPWQCLAGSLETTIGPIECSEPLACFPEVLNHITTHPSGRVWAGGSDEHVCILQLEGDMGPLRESRCSQTKHASRSHPDSDADRAAQLNLEYQELLQEWKSLPFLIRWLYKKPERPKGI